MDIEDALLRAAKEKAASEGRTLTSLVEEALRERLSKTARTSKGFKLRLVTVKGWPEGVDVSDRSALHDWLERP